MMKSTHDCLMGLPLTVAASAAWAVAVSETAVKATIAINNLFIFMRFLNC